MANQLILASASARRKELLMQLGVDFKVISADIDESVNSNECAEDYVCRLAAQKCQAVFEQLCVKDRENGMAVLGSDTCVVIDDKILGKPINQQDSLQMLQMLSAKWHQVFTAVSIISQQKQTTILVVCDVEFVALDNAMCQAYWQSNEPQDKAGSYAIQGKGARFVRQIKGSYSAVVGLPMAETAELLTEFDVPFWQY
jgi:septum formation protein